MGRRAVEGGYSSDAEPDFVGIDQQRAAVMQWLLAMVWEGAAMDLAALSQQQGW